MLCPEQMMIMEVVIPVLCAELLVTLILLVREVRLSLKTWRAQHQRQRALQEALEVLQASAVGLLEANDSGAMKSQASARERQLLPV